MTTTIRRYEPADASRVVELSLAAWEPVFASFHTVMGDGLYRRVHPDWRTDQAAAVRDALERNETWVAVTDATVTGFVNVIFNVEERSAEIYMIAVDPSAQRHGIATTLTEHALSEMIARGIDLAIVATGGDPGHAPARATYEKAGFAGVPQVWYAKVLKPTSQKPAWPTTSTGPWPNPQLGTADLPRHHVKAAADRHDLPRPSLSWRRAGGTVGTARAPAPQGDRNGCTPEGPDDQIERSRTRGNRPHVEGGRPRRGDVHRADGVHTDRPHRVLDRWRAARAPRQLQVA